MTAAECDFTANFKERDRLKRLADLVFELGMLRKTPRSGYQFLGTGRESVAEHSFRTAAIAYLLAEMAGADSSRAVLLALFHDLHEARTGDFNYVNRRYNSSQRTQALQDTLLGTGMDGIMEMWEELEAVESLEARLVQDADQLDFIAVLKEESDLGNPYAPKWLAGALERLRTDQGRELARVISETDHTDWWFQGPDESWWKSKNGRRK